MKKKKKNTANGDKNAYLTVEAALVLPVFIGVLLFIIYMLFFQYNRCLMEQDLEAAALWGSGVAEEDTKALETMIRERMAGMYRDKYIVWRFTELEAELKRNRFMVKGTAQLKLPLSGWNFWSKENIWGSSVSYECRRFSPVTFVRLCRGLKSLTNDKSRKEQNN